MTHENSRLNPDDASAYPADNPTDHNEVVYFEGSPALRGSLGRILLSVILGAGLIAGGVALRAQGWWVPWVGILLAAVVTGLPVLWVRSVRYRISNYRIDFERGVLSKDIDTLELWHVEDLQFHQSLLDRMLGIGRITVVGRDETTPRLILAALPNPRRVLDILKHRIITVKRQRGVIKLDAG